MKLKEAVTMLKTIDVCDLRELCDVTDEMYDEAISMVLERLEKLKKENKKLKNKIEEMKYGMCAQGNVIAGLREDIEDLEEELYGRWE